MRSWSLIALTGTLLAGCAIQVNTAGESFGPIVTNECDRPVIAGIGDSVSAAERDILEEPITMQPGWRSMVAYVVEHERVPERVVVLVGVDAAQAAMLTFDTSDIRNTAVDIVFAADCLTLVMRG